MKTCRKDNMISRTLGKVRCSLSLLETLIEFHRLLDTTMKLNVQVHTARRSRKFSIGYYRVAR